MANEIVPTNKIMEYVRESIPEADVSPDDYAKQYDEWAAGDDRRDARVAAAYAKVDGDRDVNRPLVDLLRLVDLRRPGSRELPALAVVRADLASVAVRVWRNGRVRYSAGRWRIEFECSNLGANNGSWGSSVGRIDGQARAPYIPPRVRPPTLRDHLLLWEPEWMTSNRARRAPRDPALLRKVVGHLYEVMATWELSQLEEAALRGD